MLNGKRFLISKYSNSYIPDYFFNFVEYILYYTEKCHKCKRKNTAVKIL